MPGPGIGGVAAPQPAMGSLLTQMQPPAAAGADAQQNQLMQMMTRIRDFAEQIKQLAAEVPTVADEAQQIQQLLKQMVVKAAAMGQAQTASSMMVPSGGGSQGGM